MLFNFQLGELEEVDQVTAILPVSFSSSAPPLPPPQSDFTVAPKSTIASPLLSYDLMISVDNFALVRASLATMHAEVLRTIKRKDVGDRFKIDVIYNLMRGYKFDFSLFKKINKE